MRLAIIGTGMLGGAIARRLAATAAPGAEPIMVAGRGRPPGRLAGVAGLREADGPRAAVAGADVVLLAVPPAEAGALGLDCPGALVVSVMAGVPLARLTRITGAVRAVRAMCSPAAEQGLAYTPWIATEFVTAEDRAALAGVLARLGQADEVFDEALIDLFTALTGPVPGLLAEVARVLIAEAEARGAPPAVADRAVRQLFLASGEVLGRGPDSAAQHVRAMIDYAGTTAAALERLQAAPLDRALSEALDAAIRRAATIAG